jgi:hypothetical protein
VLNIVYTLVVLCFFSTEHNDHVPLDILGSGYARIKNLWEYAKNYQYIIKRWYDVRDKKKLKKDCHTEAHKTIAYRW